MTVEAAATLFERAALHAALGDPVRLGIVDALVHSDRSPSELRELVGVESNLLAHHLEVLEAVDLVERHPSHADRRRRYVRLRPDRLGLLLPVAAIEASAVLFVCTANSARSQLAAALWNARHEVPASSAGTEPAEQIHPKAREAAARRGLDLSEQRPRRFDAGRDDAEVVVTVCDRAHELLARRPQHRRRVLHWSIADPAAAGTRRAFDAAATELEQRIDDLAPAVVLREARR